MSIFKFIFGARCTKHGARLLIVICSLFIVLGCSRPEVYKSLWQEKKFTVEPNVPVMPVPLRFYDNDSKLQYSVSNDDENLYLCIKATEERSQMKIIRAGMQIWLDTTAKKKEQVGITFPLPGKGKMKRNEAGSASGTKPDMQEMLKQNILQQTQMELSGFKNSIDGLLPVKNYTGISAKVDFDSLKFLTYKLIIPFRTFYKNTLSLSDSTRKFDLTIILNGIAMQNSGSGGKGSGRSGGGGMGGGGMGGMGGGGMRGGGGMGGGMRGGGGGHGGGEGGTEKNPLSETNKFLVRFKLATK